MSLVIHQGSFSGEYAMKRICILCAVICFSLMSFGSALADDLRLTYLTEDAPPCNYLENGEAKGVGVDILKAIWKRLGHAPQKIQVMPWSKAYQASQTQTNTVLFGTARLDSREQMFKWVGPIFLKSFVLFAPKQSQLRAVDFEDMNTLRIGTTRDDAAEQELVRRGIRLDRMVRVQGLKEQLELLDTNKVDVIARDDMTVLAYMAKHGLKKETVKKVKSISSASLWYAFSKDVPDKVVKEFQDSLNELKKDGTVARLMKDYGIGF
jgi:polar amino acid transport system substrate-binding protein